MITSPLVTVLMTVYNGAEYLKTSVSSIITQTFKDFEFLIVNDYSTDDSVKIIESFNDRRIVIHNNERNLGQTKSLNIGLKLAAGKYVARMDADDVAFPLWLEKMVKYMSEHPGYAAISPAVILIDSAGKTKKIRRVPISFHEVIFRLFFDSPMNHVSVLMDKDLVREHGGYDINFKITQDYELWSSLIRSNYKITNVSDILMSCRVHSRSTLYVEADKRVLEEMPETILRNINFFTDLKLTYDDTVGICKLFYQTSGMSQEEFERAEADILSIYANMKEEFNFPPEFIKSKIRTLMLKPYCVLAISEIQDNKIKPARKIALKYCRKYSFRLIPFLIYLSTFFGREISGKLPLVYEKWLELTTKVSN
jgi:glycosyltransferase involved in cell wall biosynthesis